MPRAGTHLLLLHGQWLTQAPNPHLISYFAYWDSGSVPGTAEQGTGDQVELSAEIRLEGATAEAKEHGEVVVKDAKCKLPSWRYPYQHSSNLHGAKPLLLSPLAGAVYAEQFTFFASQTF